MTKTLPLLLLLFLLFGKHRDQVVAPKDPDYTVGLTGKYRAVFYQVSNRPITLPSNSSTGRFDVTKIDLTHVQSNLILTTSEKDAVWRTDTFALTRDMDHEDLYHVAIKGKKSGIITASNIFLDLVAPDSTVTVIRAKR